MDCMRRAIVPLAVLGILGLAALSIAAEPAAAPAVSDPQLAGAPVLPETFAAPSATPVGPCLTSGAVFATPSVSAFVVERPASSKVDRDLFLIGVEVFEKYLGFRESLTTP